MGNCCGGQRQQQPQCCQPLGYPYAASYGGYPYGGYAPYTGYTPYVAPVQPVQPVQQIATPAYTFAAAPATCNYSYNYNQFSYYPRY